MVRATVGLLLCVQHAMGDSALMQTSGQSEHILEVMHSGSGRVAKMQENTQAMETQYKGLLQNIVNAQSLVDPATGKPFLPSSEFFDTVNKQFTSLLDELNSERETNIGLLNDALAEVAKTNTDMQGLVANMVATELAKVRTDRGNHAACRNNEDADIASMEEECGKFETLSSKCSDDQNWYAAAEDSSIAGGGDNTLTQVINQAEVCRNKVVTTDTTAISCDTAQNTFRNAYCTYQSKHHSVCSTHTSAYNSQMTAWTTTMKSVKALEAEQKIIYKMVKKVQCYIAKLENAKNEMPKQSDIEECAAFDPTTTPLDITYEDPEPKQECEKNDKIGSDDKDYTFKVGGPASGSWYDLEMAGLTAHGKLNANCACGPTACK